MKLILRKLPIYEYCLNTGRLIEHQDPESINHLLQNKEPKTPHVLEAGSKRKARISPAPSTVQESV